MIAIISLLLASHVFAIRNSGNLISMATKSITQSLESRSIDSVIGSIQQRESAPAPGMSGVNMTKWSSKTEAACETSLKSMNGRVSNPSGMAVCYNLPYLDEKTGVFEANLRIYMVTASTGSFNNIPSDKIDVSLDYNGATVSPVNASVMRKRQSEDSSMTSLQTIYENKAQKSEVEPKLIQMYNFIGQVNKSLLPLDVPGFQRVLTPVVTLSAIDSTGANVKTSLSSDELTFVNGVFAKKLTNTVPLLAPPIQTLVVAPDAPFVVPGLNILIFPVGLIITGTWTVLIIATIGYGTYGRIQWREQFRETKLKESRSSMSTI
ncbi:hypothetical protein GcC1_126017 [Golovinomyces cichoracearum]|uniref:Protein BIG1 n=1 Tax=Golovinomyces cichoracearum TaxID=62708 RepID=A0A420I5P1_9PEZI|nr:hypothetical protein GcC1_126017 [Golovinomyces cichoracearum]